MTARELGREDIQVLRGWAYLRRAAYFSLVSVPVIAATASFHNGFHFLFTFGLLARPHLRI